MSSSLTIGELSAWLEDFAPPALAEEWDNVGLLMGDPSRPASRVMTCLTVTPESAGEAIERGVDLIVSHHPIFFRPTRRLTADRVETAHLWALARHGVAVYSPHTAFDNTIGGINDLLAERLGLVNVGPLDPLAVDSSRIVVFTPEGDRERVLAAAFEAGAGRIGDYTECSFAIPGEGTFRGGAGTNPVVGTPGELERVAELRLEFGCPEARRIAVVRAIRSAHPYEEPALDVYPIRPATAGPGRGRIGTLDAPIEARGLAQRARDRLGANSVEWTAGRLDTITRVAIACGAGDDLLGPAIKAGADLLLTGEARFHRVVEARAAGIGLMLVGHYASERPGIEELAGRIARAFAGLECWSSRLEVDPLIQG